jgi:hypothetical protein
LRRGDLGGSHFLLACRCVEETARKIETRQAICLGLGLIRQAIAFFSLLAVFVGGGHGQKPPYLRMNTIHPFVADGNALLLAAVV